MNIVSKLSDNSVGMDILDEIVNEVERLNLASVSRTNPYLYLSREAWLSLTPSVLTRLAASGFVVWQDNSLIGKCFVIVEHPLTKNPS